MPFVFFVCVSGLLTENGTALPFHYEMCSRKSDGGFINTCRWSSDAIFKALPPLLRLCPGQGVYRIFICVVLLAYGEAVVLMAHTTLDAISRAAKATAKAVPRLFLIMMFSFPFRAMDWLDHDHLKKFKRFCEPLIGFDPECPVV